jgi:LemA protein
MLAFARRQFNDAVMEYNAAVRQYPTVLIVGLFGFRGAGTL